MKIEKLQNCTGCHACYTVCKTFAVSMIPNEEGFLYPQIDKAKCVECGLCEKTCPVLSPIQPTNEQKKVFAALNKNEEVRLESSSGGLFTALAEKVIDEGGVVFGAKFTDDFSVVHSWTDSSARISLFRGSKYIQSEIGNNYRDCKAFLDQGRKVLFTGTPCQIAGLKNVLRKDYDNLLLAEIVCHGVPSKILWNKYRDYLCSTYNSILTAFSFRNKDKGWLAYHLYGEFKNNSIYSCNHNKDPYMNLYLSNNCLRESCYSCKFKNFNTCSDITLGDFWGINNILSEMFDNKGTSLIVANTLKGREYISQLTGCIMKELKYADCILYNPSIFKSASRGMHRDTFFTELNTLLFRKIVKYYGIKNPNLFLKMKKIIIKLVKKFC